LHTVDTVDTVREEDEDEDECNLSVSGRVNQAISCGLTFMPYWSFATIGLSEMKLNSLRLAVKGIGMMRVMNSTISATRRANT
jgi:hypothetical protein